MTDSRAQQAAITLIIATLEQLSSLGEENHETLRSNCAMSSSRLLKKPDQCRSVATCAHVFWSGHYTQEDRGVMEVSGYQAVSVFCDIQQHESLTKCSNIGGVYVSSRHSI